MIDISNFRVGDTVGHPSWGASEYTCTRIENGRFYLNIGGDETGFPFYAEFYVVKKIPRKRSGFSQFIRKVEGG